MHSIAPMSPTALRIASIAAALSAVTTFLLWLLPQLYAAPSGFEATIALHDNQTYLARLWVNFVHIPLALVAYGAAAYLFARRSLALAAFGFMCFAAWGLVELIGVTTNIFALNATWRADYATATPEVQAQLRTLLLGFRGVWDALFFLLLIGFLLGTLCFGVAAWRGRGMERAVSVLMLLAVPLTIGIIVGGYTSVTAFDSLVSWAYPVLQPVSRFVLAIWLWQSSSDLRNAASSTA
jgi:hypothetical protein